MFTRGNIFHRKIERNCAINYLLRERSNCKRVSAPVGALTISPQICGVGKCIFHVFSTWVIKILIKFIAFQRSLSLSCHSREVVTKLKAASINHSRCFYVSPIEATLMTFLCAKTILYSENVLKRVDLKIFCFNARNFIFSPLFTHVYEDVEHFGYSQRIFVCVCVEMLGKIIGSSFINYNLKLIEKSTGGDGNKYYTLHYFIS